MYLLAFKILGPLALIVGAWWYHTDAVSDAHEQGMLLVRGQWEEADRIAKAVGDETSKLLKRGTATIEGELNAKLKTLAARDAARARDTTVLRDLIGELASAPPSSRDSCPAAERYATDLRSCRELLIQGAELADEGAGLVEAGEARLKALQDWTRLIQSDQP